MPTGADVNLHLFSKTPKNNCNPKIANKIIINSRKITTFPKSGNASRREPTNTLIPLMELMFLSGLKILTVLRADKFRVEKNERKLEN